MNKLLKEFSKIGIKKRRSPKKKSRKGIKILNTTFKEPKWVKKRQAKRTWAQAAQEARNKKVKQKKVDKLRKRRSGNVKNLTKLFAKMDTKDKHKFNRSPKRRRKSPKRRRKSPKRRRKSPKKYRISKRRRSYNKKLLLLLATISAANAKPMTLKEEEKFRKLIAREFKDCETIPQKYRKLALKNHPDKGGNPVKMILLNKEKEKYDKKCKKKRTSLREGMMGTMAALGTLEYRRRRKKRKKKGKRGF